MDSSQKRKVTTAVVVLLLSPILFLLICIMVLFLAPGVKIFGVRFVANGTSICQRDEQFAMPSGDIYIKTTDVPITINYIPYQTVTLKFHQVFNGLTRSNVREADLAIAESGGDLHLTTTEITTWLYSNKDKDNYFFELNLPANYQGHSLFIESHNSSVTINGNGRYSTFSVKTSASLKVADSISATNFIYHTSKAIELSQEKVSCTNADLSSTSNPITVKYALSGDLKASTNSGDIKFVSCNTLTASTSSGNVAAYGPGYPSVKNAVKFNSKRGSITLGNVGENNANSLSEIVTNGSVYITKLVDGKITSERGKINIGEMRTGIINSKLGNVTVGSVSSQLVVHGQNGNVDIGNVDVVNDVWVETTTGKITVRNTVGSVYLHSSSNNVQVTNLSSTKFTLLAGGKLTATDLQGDVIAEANGATVMSFKAVTGDVVLVTHTKCKSVVIDATCVSHDSVGYMLVSTKGKAQTVTAGDTVVAQQSIIDNYQEGKPNFDISGSYAAVTLKLGV